jgi:hypothetical protein
MATFTANSIELGTGAQFVGTATGLSNAPTGSIIQTAIQGATSDITSESDGSYKDILSVSFTPRKSNSKIIYTLMFNDFYPVINIFDFDQPNTTSAITYKLQGRKYNGNSSKFATRFGEPQKSAPAVGNTMVMKLEELSV